MVVGMHWRGFGEAPGCGTTDADVRDWMGRLDDAVSEATTALASNNPALLLAAARGLHFLAGEFAGNCDLRERVLASPDLKRRYPRLYLTQDKITAAMHRIAQRQGHEAFLPRSAPDDRREREAREREAYAAREAWEQSRYDRSWQGLNFAGFFNSTGGSP